MDEFVPAILVCLFFFFQAEDGIRDLYVTGVQTCALPISPAPSVDVSALGTAPADFLAPAVAGCLPLIRSRKLSTSDFGLPARRALASRPLTFALGMLLETACSRLPARTM